MNSAKIPVDEYAALAPKFNPVQFDPGAWADLAVAAGMKYVVITAKHHDGFAMFPSRASPWNIRDATSFKRDPIKELGDACRARGLKFGVYYSQCQDWHHPGGAAYGEHWDPKQDGDYDAYLKNVAAPQVRELLERYGPLAILWWDTPKDMTPERAALFAPLLALQPGLITNNRLGGGVGGDTETPEQEIPANGYPGRDWETCMTMNDTWGFKADDHNWKPVATLIHNLADIASKGGNYLLNVGPTAEGVIPAESIERLQAVGAWMQANGESVYGTTAGPFRKLSWGRCTAKPGKLYLHVFDWPADGMLVVPGLKSKVTGASLLAATGKRLAVAAGSEGVTVTVPARPADSVDTVVVLAIEGAPVVERYAIRPDADGALRLHAFDADIHGTQARYESGGGHDNIGYWTDHKDWVSWDVSVARAGVYTVELTVACDKRTGGATFEVSTGASKLSGEVKETGSWTTFTTVRLGMLTLRAGRQTIAVKPLTMPGIAVMNLKQLALFP
ncbi:MAG: alpha-L-fucosidase, partial [bacterium]